MFRECFPACVGAPAFVDRTVQPVAFPFDDILLAVHSDRGDFGVLTPTVMVPGSGIFECLVTVRTTKGHGESW